MRQFLLPGRWAGERTISLSGNDFHYLTRVLRKRAGDTLAAVSTGGARFSMLIAEVGRSSCRVELTPVASSADGRPAASALEPAITTVFLLQCLPKGAKMDLIVRQAVEAGVSRIVPILSEHSLAAGEGHEKRLARWRRIAREALQQSGNARLPSIEKPLPLGEALALLENRGVGLFFHQENIEAESLHRTLAGVEKGDPIGLLVGPEGGLSHTEVGLLRNAGFHPVFLGEAVLRTETAAIYAIAAVTTLLRERDTWTLSG